MDNKLYLSELLIIFLGIFDEESEDYEKVNNSQDKKLKSEEIVKRSKCAGCFSGLKDSKIARMHTFLFFLKRFLQCVVLFWLRDLGLDAKLGIYFALQIIFFSVYVVVKPHKLTKDQLIEMISEAIYIILISRLFFYNKQNDWTDAEKIFFLALIVGSFVIQTIISLGNL